MIYFVGLLLILFIPNVASAKPHYFVGKYNLNHRSGYIGDPTIATDEANTEEDIDSTISHIAQSLKRNVNKGDDSEARNWKRLGKLLLDSEEYAEAALVFRRGAVRCSKDEGLNHHLKVYNAFHGETETINNCDSDDSSDTITPTPLDLGGIDRDVFLTLDVPPSAVPASILTLAKKHSGIESPQELAKLLHASKEPIFSREACKYIIDCAQKKAGETGWTKDRHVQAPTCDIPTFALDPPIQQWLRNAIVHQLFPILASAFPSEIRIDPQLLRIQDMFVVRYDGNDEDGPGFNHLKPHEDESIISLTIALNDMKEYEGGVLFIPCTEDLLNGDAGTVLAFAGQIVHGGFPVKKGSRWILTIFVYIDENLSGKRKGYILDSIDERLSMLSRK